MKTPSIANNIALASLVLSGSGLGFTPILDHGALSATGDPTPALFGGTISTPTGTGLYGLTGSAGDVIISDNLTGSAGGVLTDYWLGLMPATNFGLAPIEHVLQEGEPEPAGSGATFTAAVPALPPVVDVDVNDGGVTVSALLAGGPPPADSGVYHKAPGAGLKPLLNPASPIGTIAGLAAPGPGLAGDTLDDFPEVTTFPGIGDAAYTAGILPGGVPGFGIGDEILCVGGAFAPSVRVATTSSAAAPSPSPAPFPGPGGIGWYFQGPFSDLDSNLKGDVSFVNFLAGAPGAASPMPAGESVHFYDSAIAGISPTALIIGPFGTPVPTAIAAYPFPQVFSDIAPPLGGSVTMPTLSSSGTCISTVAYGPGIAAPAMPAGIDTGFVMIDYSLGFIDDSVREGMWTFGDGSVLGDVSATFFTVNDIGEYAFVNTRTSAAPVADTAICVGIPGGAMLRVIESKPAPDGFGGHDGTYATFAGPYISSPGAGSGSGVIAFHATLAATSKGPLNDEAIFVSVGPGSPVSGEHQVIREGDPVTLPGGFTDTIISPLDTTPEIVWIDGEIYVLHDAVLASGTTAVLRNRLDFNEGRGLKITKTGASSVEVSTYTSAPGYFYQIRRDTTLPFTSSATVAASKKGDGTPLKHTESGSLKAYFLGNRFPLF